jgi:uncharacterized protein YkwD
LLATAVLALAGLGVACTPEAPAPPECPSGPPDAITSTVYNAVNSARLANGLNALAWNARLACLAAEWSNVMASQGYMVHRDLGSTIRSSGFESYTGLGENIFVGPGSSSGDLMHGAWMGSPSHRDNIMGQYDAIGVAYARSGDGRLWATENFGRH